MHGHTETWPDLVLQSLEEKKLSSAEKKNPAEKTDREQPFTRVGEAVS